MTKEIIVVDVKVYGSKRLCATCLHLPSSEETASWLESALSRDYGDSVRVSYIDIDDSHPSSDDPYIADILADRYTYPLVVIDGEIVGEGNPRLKAIRCKLNDLGLQRNKRA